MYIIYFLCLYTKYTFYCLIVFKIFSIRCDDLKKKKTNLLQFIKRNHLNIFIYLYKHFKHVLVKRTDWFQVIDSLLK